MTRVIAIANQKGGTGKTTCTVNLGFSLSKNKKRVLIIDLDPQGNATTHLGINPYEVEKSIYEVLVDSLPVKEVIRSSEVLNFGTSELLKLDVIPSNIELSGAEIELVNTVGRETVLRDSLKGVKNSYDYILIDCPPSLSLLTLNALTTASEVFIPMQTEFFALDGIRKLLDTIDIVKKRINKNLRITGVILTLYDNRKNICKDVAEKVKEFFKDKVFETKIRDNVKLSEAPSYGKPISLYDPKSYGALDYEALANEVLNHEKDRLRGKSTPVD
ncbi:MAG: AAA family ATPase [Candidatus Omnitrophica bacterium]|nr:AAA family ATPase [Candidatus Omnitrophota bacterium]